MTRLKNIAWTALALTFLAFSWLWGLLAPMVQAVIDLLPLRRMKIWIGRFLEWLPPYPTLLIFLIPLVGSEGIKFFAYGALAHKRIVAGGAIYIFAEIVRLGLVAYIFKTCRAKLLSIPWFAWLYGWFDRAHQWAHRQWEPIKAWIKHALHEAGLLGADAGLWSRIKALWRYSRRSTASPR